MVPVNLWAVLVSAIVAMALGFLWYGPLFGKAWMQMMGVTSQTMNDPAMKKSMWWRYLLMFIGALLTNYVLAHALVFASTYMNVSGLVAGLQAGFFNWIGFIAPVTLGAVLWENKPWKFWFLNAGYYLVYLLIAGMILASWM